MGVTVKHFDIYDGATRLDAVLSMPEGTKVRPGETETGTAGSKIPLCIILHGFTGNKDERHLLAVSDMMNELGMATLRADFYGHGLSDGEFKHHTLDIWVSNALAEINYARSTNLFSKIYLCGHSQGGLTVMLAGTKFQNLIDGIIPMSPAIVILSGARKGDLLGNKFDTNNIPGGFQAKEGWILCDTYIRSALSIEIEPVIAAFKKPVFIVHGSADATCPIDEVMEAAKGYADCTFVPIEGDTHCFDNHLDEAVAAIRDYLVARQWV